MTDVKTPAVAGHPPQKLVTELKVSGNLMTLDAGLFCIFNAPGSAVPDAATGLPGVRVSLPPGPVFRPEAVTITSFRDDGWLGGWNGAALVRVTRGPAQILVTIYQAPNTTAEAPRLQILRLAESAALPPLGIAAKQAPAQTAAVQALAAPGAPAAAVPVVEAPKAPPPTAAKATSRGPNPGAPGVTAPQNTPAAAAQVADPDLVTRAEIIAHIQGRGDVATKLDAWMGEPGSKRWVEGFAVSPKGVVGPNDIEYQAVLGRGWLSPWSEGGQYCGSRGMSLPILGLRMRLRGEAADRFDCILTASFIDGTRIGPRDNGEPCQADSMAPLEAFRIDIVAREAAVEAPPAKPAKTTGRKVAEAPPAPAARAPMKAPAPAAAAARKPPPPAVAPAKRAAPAPAKAPPVKPAASRGAAKKPTSTRR